MKKYIFSLLLISGLFGRISAQPDINYLDGTGYLLISGGGVIPGSDFSNSTETGLFAENGYQFGFDYNYTIGYGMGIGGNIEFNQFRFNGEKFLEFSNAETIFVNGGYSSAKFGLNLNINIPVLLGSDDYVINFFGEGNAGIRTMSAPGIDLTYNEVANKYVEVSYRSRSNTMGFLGYSGGLQFLFLEKFGISVSYTALLRSRHSIKYSVRMFDAAEQLYEEENYINGYLDHTGYQIGFLFLFGR